MGMNDCWMVWMHFDCIANHITLIVSVWMKSSQYWSSITPRCWGCRMQTHLCFMYCKPDYFRGFVQWAWLFFLPVKCIYECSEYLSLTKMTKFEMKTQHVTRRCACRVCLQFTCIKKKENKALPCTVKWYVELAFMQIFWNKCKVPFCLLYLIFFLHFK